MPFVAAVAAAAVGISLGQWQTRRAIEKESIETMMTERESEVPVTLRSDAQSVEGLEFRRVIVKGEFLRDWNIYLDNRPYKGAAGFYVLTPMKIAGSDMHVLVARGWVKRDIADRTKLPEMQTPDGVVAIEGVVRRHQGHVLQLGSAEPIQAGAIVQNAEVADVARATKLKFQPFMVEQVSDTKDGLVRDWPKPSSGKEKHRGYAFQWYALATTAILFFVVTGFRRGTK